MNANQHNKNEIYEVRFLKHSGVMIETKDYQLFFDVISDVSEYIVSLKKQIFFISHGHHDHFDLRLSKHKDEDSRYIVSDDIKSEEIHDFGANVSFIKPGESIHLDDLIIKAYESTDLGVSFYVKTPNCNVFHSGDLNWWHWVNSPKSTQLEEESAFKAIMDKVMENPIDVAFIPMDPRLGIAATWAIRYFLDNSTTKKVIPIHFGDQFEAIKNMAAILKADVRLYLPSTEGEALI